MADREARIALKTYLEDTAKAEFKQLEAALKDFAREVEQAADKLERLGNASKQAAADIQKAAQDVDAATNKLGSALTSAMIDANAFTQSLDYMDVAADHLQTTIDDLTTRLDEQPDKATQAANATKDYANALDQLDKSVSKAATNLTKLTTSTADQSNALKQSTKDADAAAAALDKVSTAEDKVSNSSDKKTKKVRDQSTALKTHTADTDQTSDALNRASRAMDFLDDAMDVAEPVIAACFATLNKMFTSAGDLEAAMSKLGVRLGLSGDAFEELRLKIIEISDTSNQTAADIADSWSLLAERQYALSEILDAGLGQAVVTLADATDSDLRPATELLVTALQNFNLEASDASDVADMLTLAYKAGVPDVLELQGAIEDLGGYADLLDIKLYDFLATLTLLSNSGFPDVSDSAGILVGLLDTIVAPSDAAKEALQSVGLVSVDGLTSSFYDLHGNLLPLPEIINRIVNAFKDMPDKQKAENLAEIFGSSKQDAGKIANTPQEKIDQAKQTSSKMQKEGTDGKAGASSDEATRKTNEFNTAVANLQKTITNFMATVGTPVINFLTPIIADITRLTGSLSQANPQLLTFIGFFLLIALVLTPLVIIVTLIAVVAAILGGPIVLGILAVAGGIALLGAGAGLAAANWGTLQQVFAPLGQVMDALGKAFSSAFSGSWTTIGPMVMDALGAAGKTLQEAFSALGPTFSALKPTGDALVVVFTTITAVVGGILVGAFEMVMAVVGGLAVAFGGIGVVIAGVIQVISAIFLAIQGVVQAIIGIFTGDFSAAIASFQAAWQALSTGVSQIVQGLVITITGLVGGLVMAVVGFFHGLWEGTIKIFQDLYKQIVGASIIPDMVTGILKWIGDLPKKVMDFLTKLVADAVKAFQDWKKKAEDETKKLVDGIVKTVTDLVNKMRKFGEDVVKFFADGIKAGINWVEDAVKEVVQKVQDMTKGQSPPKEGPLSDSDQYMPNLMRMFADGIRGSKHMVLNEIANLAREMSVVTPTINGIRTQHVFQQAKNSQPINVWVLIDGKPVEARIIGNITNALQMQGLSRMYR